MKHPERIGIEIRPASQDINWPWVAVCAILAVMTGSLLWLVSSFLH